MSLNKVMLIGRLGKDVELKYTQAGNPVANISLATDESYTAQDGNKVQKTEWHRVIVYGKQAENCANFLHKGSMAFIEGSLATRKWTNQQGQDQFITEIKAQRVIFLDAKNNSNKADSKPAESAKTGGTPEIDSVPF